MSVRKIRVKFSSRKSLHNILNQLRKSNVKYSTEDTSGSFKIKVIEKGRGKNADEVWEKTYEYNEPGDLSSLGVYMKLKKEILGRPKVKLRHYTPRDLRYWKIRDWAEAPAPSEGSLRHSGRHLGRHLDSAVNMQQTLKRISAKGRSLRKVINIDVKKAYPYAFYNMGLIGKPVLKYLLDLDKKGRKIARLKGMGILAKRKLVNNYTGAKLRNYEIRDDKYLRDCFFGACKIIDDLMLKCCEISGGNLLFFWVDGIYINADGNKKQRAKARAVIKRLCSHIKSSGYKYSKEMLRDFKYGVETGDNGKQLMAISFKKRSSKKTRDKSGKLTRKWGKKPKTFTLPLNKGFQERID